MAKSSGLDNLEQVLEGILFAYGESIIFKKLTEVTKKTPSEISLALENLKKNLELRGIKLINKNDNWQLTAGKASAEFIEKLVKNEMQEELTPASLEVLAMVAYRGPVSKSQVEIVRGVNCTYALRNLTLRGLIEKNEKIKPQTYQISLAALRKLGLEKEHDLPKYNELKNDILKVETLIEKQ